MVDHTRPNERDDQKRTSKKIKGDAIKRGSDTDSVLKGGQRFAVPPAAWAEVTMRRKSCTSLQRDRASSKLTTRRM
jgi:hypothetical protein